jgi:hypothetical protein
MDAPHLGATQDPRDPTSAELYVDQIEEKRRKQGKRQAKFCQFYRDTFTDIDMTTEKLQALATLFSVSVTEIKRHFDRDWCSDKIAAEDCSGDDEHHSSDDEPSDSNQSSSERGEDDIEAGPDNSFSKSPSDIPVVEKSALQNPFESLTSLYG